MTEEHGIRVGYVPDVTLNHVRRGSGSPLLLVHGLGAGRRSWAPILDELAERREVIAVDLPGFGETPPSTGEVSIATLTDSVADFIREQAWTGSRPPDSRWAAASCSSSPGGASAATPWRWTRGASGATVRSPSSAPRCGPRSLWSERCAACCRHCSAALWGRTLLLAQLSPRPWALSRETVLPDVRGLADSPAIGAAMDALTKGPKQQGAPAGTAPGRVTIGWGRRDLVTVPRQAARATELYPDAVLHWFERCGHFPQWDAPHEATRLILDRTD